MNASPSEIAFPALNGSSLLGFLAALGTLETLSKLPTHAGARMKWIPSGSSYHPVLQTTGLCEKEALLEKLDEALRTMAGHRVITIDQDLKIPSAVFRHLAETQAKIWLEQSDLRGAPLVAAFGCDVIADETGNIKDTAFRTMGGAGHQHFLGFMETLAKETNREHLREALFGPWRYRDPSPSLRWDSEDDRRYALRWDEPSKDPARTVRGANRLAMAALPLFAVVPVSQDSVSTTGFMGRGSRDTFVTWPLWSGWLNVDTVRSLLSFPELQKSETTSADLANRGICAVFRAQRMTLGKFRNFSPAKAL